MKIVLILENTNELSTTNLFELFTKVFQPGHPSPGKQPWQAVLRLTNLKNSINLLNSNVLSILWTEGNYF